MVDMQLSSVVLPEPDGPMMATNSPRVTSKLTPASAYMRFWRPPNTFSILRTQRMGEDAERDDPVTLAGGVAMTSDMDAPSRARHLDGGVGEHASDDRRRNERDGSHALRHR